MHHVEIIRILREKAKGYEQLADTLATMESTTTGTLRTRTTRNVATDMRRLKAERTPRKLSATARRAISMAQKRRWSVLKGGLGKRKAA